MNVPCTQNMKKEEICNFVALTVLGHHPTLACECDELILTVSVELILNMLLGWEMLKYILRCGHPRETVSDLHEATWETRRRQSSSISVSG